MPNIYMYNSSHKFLRDAWERKKKANPKFSIRSWAKNLGLEGHAYLNRILNGKAKVSKKYVPLFIKSLKLSTQEGVYLDALVDYERAKTLEEKNLHQTRLQELSPRKLPSFFEVDAFKYLSDPLHILILEMVDLYDFQSCPKWIKERVHLDVSLSEINETIKRLINLNLLEKKEDGRLCKTQARFSNKIDVASEGTQKYHQNVSVLAAKSISEQGLSQREYNGYVINMDPDSMPEAKQEIRAFLKSFVARFGVISGQAKNSYQFNLQLFELTKMLAGEEK